MTHPRDEIRRALASVEAWLDSDLAFGLDAVPRDPDYTPRAAAPVNVAPANLAPAPRAASPSRPVSPSTTSNAPRAPSTRVASTGRSAPPPVPSKPTSAPASPTPPPPPPRVVTKAIPPPDVPVPVPPLREWLGSSEKREKMAALADRIYGCAACRLGEARTYAVPGEGNVDADLMFIGEGPGADENRSGRPFVGASGELLSKIIQAIGFTRESIFIANIVKCQPPDNRAPAPDEIGACFSYLRQQVEIVKPKVICTLGSPATRTLLGVTSGITQLRGKMHAYGGAIVVPTFHPAYLLRTPEDKPLVWQDAQTIAKLVLEKGGVIPHPEVFERNRRGKS